MKIKSFVKTIYNSSLVTSIILNVLTSLTLFVIIFSLITNIYKDNANYINKIFINDLLLISDNIKLNDLNSNKNPIKTDLILSDSNSYYVEYNFDYNKILTKTEADIFLKYNMPNNISNRFILFNNSLYLINSSYINEKLYLQFLNISKLIENNRLIYTKNIIGFQIDENIIYTNVATLLNKKFNYYISNESLAFSENSNVNFIYSFDNLLYSLVIFILSLVCLSLLRIIITVYNTKKNIDRISKPLNDLVFNTEKLASHEVCEKLNRFDYPYNEFKKVSEAFNKVLLSKELSEIKLFRSFEQMENIVHKRTQELLKSNTQLTEAMKKAEEANSSKSQFLANISHEIRTPLNCIIGFCDIILTENIPDSITVQVQQIIHEAETLLHLINDFLDYSKIEAGKMSILESEVDLKNLFSSLIQSGKVQAGTKDILLEYIIDDEVPQIVISDELRIYQIVSNIFFNAIKFTPKGSIKIDIKIKNKELIGKANLVISITDTGIGIPESSIDSIFNKFEQVDGSLTRKYRGSGLGLTICKKIVELMNGSIDVYSKINKGSRFNIEFPVKLVNNEKKLDENSRKSLIKESFVTNSGSILLVEDYPVNQIVAKKHLELNNHTVTLVDNGQEAVEICNKLKFDLILMDLQMPVMDGFRATNLIRTSSVLNSSTPILAMTANALEAAKQSCLDAGMNSIITKPIRKDMFLKEVDRWLCLDETTVR